MAAPPDGVAGTLKSGASTRAGANWNSDDALELIPVLIISICGLQRNPQLELPFGDPPDTNRIPDADLGV
jgi:hypothetical protein